MHHSFHHQIIQSIFLTLIFLPLGLLSQTTEIIEFDDTIILKDFLTSRTSQQYLEIDLPLNNGKESCINVQKDTHFYGPNNQFGYNIISIDGQPETGKVIISPRGIYCVFDSVDGLTSLVPNAHKRYALEKGATVDPRFKEHAYCSYRGKQESSISRKPLVQNGEFIRRYRMAIACTGEYYLANGGNDAEVMDWVLFAVSGLNLIYERDLAISFVLDSRVTLYNDPQSDPFIPIEEGDDRVFQAGRVINSLYALDQYDIGHVLHNHSDSNDFAGGGVAWLGSACDDSVDYESALKAYGWSGHFSNQENDFIRLFAHEIGHQFGAAHTFNGSGEGACDDQHSFYSGYEIGSGTTIMSYNGLCSSDQNISIQDDSERSYFNVANLYQIIDHVNGIGSCFSAENHGNSPPAFIPNECDLNNYDIPKRTPFMLRAEVEDADADPITYCWEQYDEDPNTQGFIGVQASLSNSAPLYRSFPPTNDPIRIFPSMEVLLTDDSDPFEVLSQVEREINFRITARDNHVGGGGIAIEEMIVEVVDEGPLTVIIQGEEFKQGDSLKIDWNVRTTMDMCDFVNIDLSLDGGKTFEYNIATNIPYADEFYGFLIPGDFANVRDSRIRIMCVDHPCYAFFNISQAFDIEFGEIQGEAQFCSELETQYSYTNAEGFNTFNWTLNGITIAENENPIYIEFPNGDSFNTLCIEGTNTDGFPITDCTFVSINNLEPTMLFDSICPGECRIIDDIEFCIAGAYEIPFSAVNGCDSMVVFDLKEISSFDRYFEHDLCQGDTIYFAGAPYFDSGAFQQTLGSSRSCDSILNIQLNFVNCNMEASYEIDFINCDSRTPGSMILTALQGTPPFSYEWQLITTTLSGAGGLSSLDDDVVYNNLPPGTYIATVTDANGNQDIVIESVPDPIKFELLLDTLSEYSLACNGDENGIAALETFGNTYNYRWSNGETSKNVDNLSAGFYTISVSNEEGCEVIDSFTITEPEAMQFAFTSENPECPEELSGRINFGDISNGTFPYEYSINLTEFDDDPDFDELESGSYTLLVRDSAGCTSANFVELSDPETIDITLPEQLVVGLGESVIIEVELSNSNYNSITWTNSESLDCNDCLNPSASPFDNVTYTLMIEDLSGCIYERSIEVVVVKNFDFYLGNVINCSSNDENSVLKFHPGETVERVVEFRIYDRWGHILTEVTELSDLENIVWDGTQDGRKVAPGVYLYFIEIEFIGGTVIKQPGQITVIN